MVAFDSTILSLLLFPDADLRQGKAGQSVERAGERVAGLIRELESAKEHILVPAPTLCEVLVNDGVDAQDVMGNLGKAAFIRLGDFDQRAAIELACHEVRPANRRHRAREWRTGSLLRR